LAEDRCLQEEITGLVVERREDLAREKVRHLPVVTAEVPYPDLRVGS
jgi:hypothetical protein